jgi:hypothetical protein
MSDRFDIKQGDRLPTLRIQCLDGDDVPVDLTTSTTRVFNMRRSDTGVVAVSSGACTVITSTAGILDYAWAAGDTATAGDYEGEVKVNFPGTTGDDRFSTFPGEGFIGINIEARVST